ncbi:hypothetical protein DAEQUDRAFT_770150 [Daedalea quercina L-15889]|uniref:EKC/KEOPS complex subunit GON7 n=1 Tax=Daedalea quercina L-15889 TaxID=1314783 RepID=A0A165L4V3_9APHY|nr:hypothetical protein DAEQUDRAFT_770150 [Daedalea quercina L-15889]
MASALTVSYTLHPPPNTPAEDLQAQKTHTFSVSTERSGKEYYDSLRKAVAEAKRVLGEELTAWRDAVGTREQTKESKPPKQSDEGEEDDGGEEEEEQSND